MGATMAFRTASLGSAALRRAPAAVWLAGRPGLLRSAAPLAAGSLGRTSSGESILAQSAARAARFDSATRRSSIRPTLSQRQYVVCLCVSAGRTKLPCQSCQEYPPGKLYRPSRSAAGQPDWPVSLDDRSIDAGIHSEAEINSREVNTAFFPVVPAVVATNRRARRYSLACSMKLY